MRKKAGVLKKMGSIQVYTESAIYIQMNVIQKSKDSGQAKCHSFIIINWYWRSAPPKKTLSFPILTLMNCVHLRQQLHLVWTELLTRS